MKKHLLLILFFSILFLGSACQSPAQDNLASPQPAPIISASDQEGNLIDFEALYQQGPVLVFFYPKAGTPGCTAQACSLRDAYQDLTDKGLTVIGVSTDDAESQKRFQAEHQLPFPLIPDTESRVIDAFGVTKTAGFSSRQAFLIKDGYIVWHDASASTAQQAADVLTQLENWSKF